MEPLLYSLARVLVAFIQSLPLRWVARLGRIGGALAYALDARHRRVACRNLEMCFGQERSPNEIRSIARENFRRIGEGFACAVKTASMSFEQLQPHVEFIAPPELLSKIQSRSVVAAIGHFGNFEL